ncbi:acetoin utilization protein AcuC [Carboxydothermus ferrireducens]|uniref:Acetoin utilization protein AcuC n=1 Tax=Carboxydothermus ferrireducens DSM 11255 TaxID=1119529 RepID=A0ABX2R8A8_9THEO|nr:acetoin utilization protein AcuC [Carboxydothermus ferrireducens]NYE57411.1 acetoin utilization protein AcuC [Carboxydothermus ferrireducens DSM 11255]
MSGKAYLIYSDDYLSYRLAEDHPLNPQRYALAVELMKIAEVLKEEEIIPPRPATLKELYLVHDPAYVEAVMNLSKNPENVNGSRFGLGSEDNPVFSGMHEAAALVAGGSALGAELIYEGEADHVFNIAGGLHHALRDAASGFCIYNDLAVAIAKFREKGLKVAYVDLDAHHGDGVQWLFYSDPGVLTISIHETGRYLFPGTGSITELGEGAAYGTKINIPLEPYTEDDSWLWALEEIVPELIRKFEPDILVTQHGCDSHRFDPLTHLANTTLAFQESAKLLHELAHEVCGGRWLAGGGGGYDYWRVVPRAWTIVWAEMTERSLPYDVPATFWRKYESKAGVFLPRTFLDEGSSGIPLERRREITSKNQRTVERLKNALTLFWS